VEGNLVAAAQAIEKICLLKPEGKITAALLQAILWDESRFTVFDLVEQILAGNTAHLLHILENLKYEGTEPTLILWAITRELRLSFTLAKELNQGQNFTTLCQKYRIFSRRQPALKRFLQRFNSEATLKHLAAAMQIDKIIKGIEVADIWSALQLFCLRMV
jgi:DNA polymerase III subunit delta